MWKLESNVDCRANICNNTSIAVRNSSLQYLSFKRKKTVNEFFVIKVSCSHPIAIS